MFIFPAYLFNPKEVSVRLEQRVISGGVSITNEEDVIATDGGGRWIIEYTDISIHSPAQERAWSAWQGHLAGGTVECLVPVLSLASAPRPFNGNKTPVRIPQIAYDDPVFPTSMTMASPYITAEITAPASLRATSLEMEITKGGTIKGGEKFSIDGRLHRIVMATAPDTYRIDPPLREALSGSEDVVFDLPLLRCRAVPAANFDGSLRRGRYGERSISFVEFIAQ